VGLLLGGTVLYIGDYIRREHSGASAQLQPEYLLPPKQAPALLAAIPPQFAPIGYLNEEAVYVQERVNGVCYLVAGRVDARSAYSNPPPLLSYVYVPCGKVTNRIFPKR
jgi:hypothetical protein